LPMCADPDEGAERVRSKPGVGKQGGRESPLTFPGVSKKTAPRKGGRLAASGRERKVPPFKKKNLPSLTLGKMVLHSSRKRTRKRGRGLRFLQEKGHLAAQPGEDVSLLFRGGRKGRGL